MSLQGIILIYIFFFYSKMKANISYDNEMLDLRYFRKKKKKNILKYLFFFFFISNVIFSGDMVLFLFINLGIVLTERVIFLYNSKTRKKANKDFSKLPSKDLPENNINEFDEQNQVEEEKKETLPPNRVSDVGLASMNTLQISPIKKSDSKKAISPSKNVILFDLQSKTKIDKNKKKKESFLFYGLFLKYVFHVTLLLLFCYFTLILMPTGTTNDFPKRCTQINGQVQCVLSKTNDYLLGFYFLYTCYFLASSLQIK